MRTNAESTGRESDAPSEWARAKSSSKSQAAARTRRRERLVALNRRSSLVAIAPLRYDEESVRSELIGGNSLVPIRGRDAIPRLPVDAALDETN